MKVSIKDFIYVVIILSLVLLLLVYNNIPPGQDLLKITKLDEQKPTITKDINGKTHASKEIIVVQDPKQVASFKKQIDSLQKAMKLKDGEIQGLITAASESKLSFTPNIQKIVDSLKNTVSYTIDYKSKWFDLEGKVPSSEPFLATQRDSITLAFLKKKSGFLNMRTTYIADIHSSNINMKYYNLRAWEVPKQKAKIGIGVTIGYGAQYNRQDNNFSLGPQITGGLQFRF